MACHTLNSGNMERDQTTINRSEDNFVLLIYLYHQLQTDRKEMGSDARQTSSELTRLQRITRNPNQQAQEIYMRRVWIERTETIQCVQGNVRKSAKHIPLTTPAAKRHRHKGGTKIQKQLSRKAFVMRQHTVD